MTHSPMRSGLSRRRLLAALGSGTLAAVSGCLSDSSSSDRSSSGQSSESTQRSPSARPTTTLTPDETVQLTAATGTVTPDGGQPNETWLYGDGVPGPELRVKEGDVLRATVTNGLPEGTTIHWHGVPVANAMDGVPGLTQRPIDPESAFEYTFRAEPAGTYFYHSHAGLQLDRGLFGPLVIEERDPHVAYDREYTLVFDDYLPGEPRLPDENGSSGGMGGGAGGSGGMGGGGGMGGSGMGSGGMMGDRRPPYAGLLANGRLPSNPPTLSIRAGERVRLRFVNAASATTFRVALAGHELTISHADGRPVDPVNVGSFVFGAGERYDAIVEADSPGTWAIQAAAVDGDEPPATAVLSYEGRSDEPPTTPGSTGRRLQYSDLNAIAPIEGIDGRPDRTFDLILSAGSGRSYSWAIDGQTYPGADPLRISHGDHVRVRMVNHSPVLHPMHLHGHFFQVGNAVKDTVLVPGHMGEVTFDFLADNPGAWLFHCHNLYHLHAGMARVFEYR